MEMEKCWYFYGSQCKSLLFFIREGFYVLISISPQKAISDINDYHKITYMCNLYKEEIDATELKKFLVSFLTNHPNLFVSDGKDVVMKTNFKRLIRIYDWLIYGHKK